MQTMVLLMNWVDWKPVAMVELADNVNDEEEIDYVAPVARHNNGESNSSIFTYMMYAAIIMIPLLLTVVGAYCFINGVPRRNIVDQIFDNKLLLGPGSSSAPRLPIPSTSSGLIGIDSTRASELIHNDLKMLWFFAFVFTCIVCKCKRHKSNPLGDVMGGTRNSIINANNRKDEDEDQDKDDSKAFHVNGKQKNAEDMSILDGLRAEEILANDFAINDVLNENNSGSKKFAKVSNKAKPHVVPSKRRKVKKDKGGSAYAKSKGGIFITII